MNGIKEPGRAFTTLVVALADLARTRMTIIIVTHALAAEAAVKGNASRRTVVRILSWPSAARLPTTLASATVVLS